MALTGSSRPAPVRYPTAPPDAWPAPPPPPLPGGGELGRDWPPGGGRSGLATVLAAVAAVVALIAVAVAGLQLSRADDDPPVREGPALTEAPGSSTVPTTSPVPDDPTDPSPPPDPTDPTDPRDPTEPLEPTDPGGTSGRTLEEVLPELIAFVEQARGGRFRTRPVVTALDEAAFDAKLREVQAPELAEVGQQETTWKAFGIIEPDVDLAEAYEAAFESGVLGFYEPAGDELYVQGEEITPLREAVIVHELTHAYDDQHHDLERLDRIDDPDQAAAFLSLVEGTARWVENAYREGFTPDEEAAAADEEASLGGGLDLFAYGVSLPMLVTLLAPYEIGVDFVDALVDDGGAGAIDTAYRDRPTTTEQVALPDRYLADEEALPTPGLDPHEGVAQEGTLGQFDIRVMALAADPLGGLGGLDPTDPDLTGLLPEIRSWGGGRFVSWEDQEGRACVQFRVVQQGGTDAQAVLEDWAAAFGAERLDTLPNGEVHGQRCT